MIWPVAEKEKASLSLTLKAHISELPTVSVPMSRALTGGAPAPRVPMLSLPSGTNLATGSAPSSGSRKAPPPLRMGYRAPPIARNNTSPVILSGQVDIANDILEKPIKVSPTSGLRLSSDSGAEHGLSDLDAFWNQSSDTSNNNTRSGSLQSVGQPKVRRHATSEVVDLRELSDDGMVSSRSESTSHSGVQKRSSSVVDLRSSISASMREFSSPGLESNYFKRELGGIVADLREALSLEEGASEEDSDDEFGKLLYTGATLGLAVSKSPFSAPSSLLSESILTESSTSLQYISTSSSITRSTDTTMSSMSTMASPAMPRLDAQHATFSPSPNISSIAVSSAFIASAVFDLPLTIPTSDLLTPRDDSDYDGQTSPKTSPLLLTEGVPTHSATFSTDTAGAARSGHDDGNNTNASSSSSVGSRGQLQTVDQGASPSLPEVLGSSAAASAHRASIHLSGLFDRASSLDLHSPHPNPRSIKADYSAFLKTNGESASGEYNSIVDMPLGVEPEVLIIPPSHTAADVEDLDDDPPLFDLTEWQRASGTIETTSTVVSMSHIIPGVTLPTNLTLKELQEMHGAEIEAFVAPIRPPSPRNRIISHPPVQRRDRRKVSSSEDSLSSSSDEPRRLLEHRRAVARSIAQTSNWDYLKHSTATESSLGSSNASAASSRHGSGILGERGGTDSGRSDTSPGHASLALSHSTGNGPRRQDRRRRSSTSSLHNTTPEPFASGAISDHESRSGSAMSGSLDAAHSVSGATLTAMVAGGRRSFSGTPSFSPSVGAVSFGSVAGDSPSPASSASASTHHTSGQANDGHYSSVGTTGKNSKRGRRKTSPISSALELEAPIPNTIVPPTGFFPPSSATLTGTISSTSGTAPPSVTVSSSSSTSGSSSNGLNDATLLSIPSAVPQDAQPVFEVEEPLHHTTLGEAGWLTAEAMMDPALSSTSLASSASPLGSSDSTPPNAFSSVPLVASGNKRRSANRRKNSKNGPSSQLANSGSPQHYHHHHHHHHHHHPGELRAGGIRSSLGELPSAQTVPTEMTPTELLTSSAHNSFGTSSSAPGPGHAMGGLGSSQTSPRAISINHPHSPGHAHASDSDSSIDDSYSPFVRMTKRRGTRSRGGSPPPQQRSTFSRSQPDLDTPFSVPNVPKALPAAGPIAPGTEAWNVEDVMNSLHHFNGGGRATRFADTVAAGQPRTDSRHRRNGSQSRLERRLCEIERRIANLEQNQIAAALGALNGSAGPGSQYAAPPSIMHAILPTRRSEGHPLANSVPSITSPPQGPVTPSPYHNQDGSSSGSGDNKSNGSGGNGLLNSSLIYAASATYSPQFGRKGTSPPVTSASTSTDSLHAASAPGTLATSISFASVAAAQAAAANPYEMPSPASAPASSHPGHSSAASNPYAVPVHESEVPLPHSAPAGAPRAPDLAITDNAYNRRFQEIMELSGPSKYIQMAALGRDFVSLAEVYGRIIVSERCLPPEQKSIKPVALGGQAGGSKFIVQGILFKYALDVKIGEGSKREKWLYGGKRRDDAAAMKAASNELLGLSSFIKCNATNNIRFPMMALIDYCGYRLVAVSTLPINANTIVYGSADAGKTVHNHDEKIANVMQDFGHDLNLREHMVFNTPITGPGDLEVHHGSDGFNYMIDFARTFPPEAPGETSHPQAIFYRLLRPELVVSHPKPLSSDAFSGWQSGDTLSDEMNEDVEEATRRLFEQVIPLYPHSSFLTHDFQALFRSEICNISDVHRRGINLRHLGLVRSEMYKATDDNDALYLVEMICRTLKTYIGMRFRALMDQLIIFAEEPFRNEALALFNLVAQPSASPDFWNVRIKTLLQRKYGASALRPEELDPTVMLLDLIPREHRLYLLRRLAWHLCVTFDDNIWNNFEDSLIEGTEFQFFPQDIKEIKPRTKYMTILDLALGITLYMQAAGAFDASRNEANILLLEEAKICLVSAWTRVSDCLVTRYFLGKVWHLLGKLRTDGGEDFARALVMIESTMVEERDRPDLRVDFAKAGVMAFIHQREPARFDRAVVHYREVSRTHPTLARTLVDDILSWLNNQHANKALDDQTFAERIEATRSVMKHVFDKKLSNLYTEMIEQLDILSAKPRNTFTNLSRSSFSGRLFTSQTNPST